MGETEVRIGLPLPMDVVGTLMGTLGVVYPSARVRTDGPFGYMTFVVDEADRVRRPGKRKLEAAHVETEDPAQEPTLAAINEDGISTGLPEDVAKHLAAICAAWLDAYPGVNYLETTAHYPESPERYVVIACKSPQQTPHELRQKAERERDDALAALERVKALLDPADPDKILGSARVRAALSGQQ